MLFFVMMLFLLVNQQVLRRRVMASVVALSADADVGTFEKNKIK